MQLNCVNAIGWLSEAPLGLRCLMTCAQRSMTPPIRALPDALAPPCPAATRRERVLELRSQRAALPTLYPADPGQITHEDWMRR